jgi:hypothetical protein
MRQQWNKTRNSLPALFCYLVNTNITTSSSLQHDEWRYLRDLINDFNFSLLFLQIFNDSGESIKWERDFQARVKKQRGKADNCTMGLHKNYLKVGQNASNQIFGIPRVRRGSTPLSMLISYGAKFNSSKCATRRKKKYFVISNCNAMMPHTFNIFMRFQLPSAMCTISKEVKCLARLCVCVCLSSMSQSSLTNDHQWFSSCYSKYFFLNKKYQYTKYTHKLEMKLRHWMTRWTCGG